MNDTINVETGPNLGNIGAVQQRPVLIDGGDRDDHGSFGPLQNIWTFTTNHNLETNAGWNLTSNGNIANSTTVPHTTITGSGNDTADFYRFDVPMAGVGQVGRFDIDGTAGVDTFLARTTTTGRCSRSTTTTPRRTPAAAPSTTRS